MEGSHPVMFVITLQTRRIEVAGIIRQPHGLTSLVATHGARRQRETPP